MKKLTILLALLTLLSLVFIACDKNDTPATETNAETSTDTEAVTTGAAEDVTTEDATTEDATTDAVTTDSIDETTAAPSIDDFFSMMESDTAEEDTHGKIDLSVSADISVNSMGVSQTNTTKINGSLAFAGDSFMLSMTNPGYDESTNVVLHNGKLFVSSPDTGNIFCEATFDDIKGMIFPYEDGGVDSEDTDLSVIPGLEAFNDLKPSELFTSATLTVDPATGAYTLVMSGLSDKAIQTLETLIALFTGTEGEIELTDDAEDDAEDETYGETDVLTAIKNILISFKNPENLKITMTFDKALKLTDLDLTAKADITPFVTSDPSNGTASASLNMSLDISYEKPTIETPADADSYEPTTLEELANLLFGGGMEGEYQFVYGTVANITTDDDGNTIAILVYDDYDDDWNKIEVEQHVLVPEELVELVISLEGCEVCATVLDSVLVDIELDVETEMIFTTVKDIATVDGITTLTLTIVDYDEMGNEILGALAITVPEELVSDVTSIAVGSEVAVEFIFDENGNATLISIDEISFVEDEIAA